MKQACLFVLALAVAPACGKHNDIDVLQHEANSAAKFYAPQLDALDARVQTIFKRGATIPASTPGVDAVTARLTEARDTIIALRGVVAPGPDGKSSVEKQAAIAAKEHKAEELEKLIHNTHAALGSGLTVVNEDLLSVESWIAYLDSQALAMPQRPAGNPAPQPDPTATVPAGQPPGPAGHPAPAAPTGGAAGGVQREPGAGTPAPAHH